MLNKLLDHRPGATAVDDGQDEQHGRTLHALFAVLLVDVDGFGVVIPLLPFSAEQFGVSPRLAQPEADADSEPDASQPDFAPAIGTRLSEGD